MDLTVLAYATLGLSLFVSAVKMGSWILHADPRTLVNGGRWALVALAALAVGVLLCLRSISSEKSATFRDHAPGARWPIAGMIFGC